MSITDLTGFIIIAFAVAWLWLKIWADVICPGPEREKRRER